MSIDIKKFKKEILSNDSGIDLGDFIIPMDMRYVSIYDRPYVTKHKPYKVVHLYSYHDYRTNSPMVYGVKIEVEHGRKVVINFPTEGFALYRSEDELFLKSLFGG